MLGTPKEGSIRYRVISKVIVSLLTSQVLILALGFTIIAPSQTTLAQASRLQDLNRQKSELQKQIDAKKQEEKEKREKAEAEKKRQAELNTAIKKLNNDIGSTESRIRKTQDQIESTQGAIVTKQEEIVGKEADLAKKKEETFETAVELHIAYEQGNELYAVLGSDRISKAIDQVNDFNGLTDKLLIDAENLERERQNLMTQKVELQQQEQNLKTQKNQLAAYQRALDVQKSQKATLVGESKEAQEKFLTEASEANKVSEQLKKQFAAVANEEAAMRRAASKRSNASAARSTNPSALGFVWPADGVITTYFGGQTPFQNYHTGLDVAESAGSPVVASAAGAVTVATKMCCSDYSGTVDKSYGYGNWVEVKHDNGYISRYAHLMEFAVTPGDRVERGQVVGYMGGGRGMAGAGWSTGPHLHFEIWDAQGPDDPLKYLP